MVHYYDFRKKEREALKGKEILHIKPIVLGGSPTDPKNVTAVTRSQHIQACRYWNKIIKELREKQQSPH
jgi:hypothetical protein